MSKKSKNSPATYTLTILGLIFITLKLCKVIAWSWWWVTAPFWSIPTLYIAGFVVFMIIRSLIRMKN